MRCLLLVSRGPEAVNFRECPGVRHVDLCWHPRALETSTAPERAHYPDRTMRKWECARAWLEQHRGEWEGLDAIGVVDDDILPALGDWDRIFSLFLETGADVAQPALTHDSYIAHAITAERPDSIWRETTFVEVMCPIFKPAALARVFPYVGDFMTSWALEAVWAKEAPLAILDATPVRHVRPLYGPTTYNFDSAEIHARYQAFMYAHELTAPPHREVPRRPRYDVAFYDTVGSAFDGSGRNAGGSEWATIKVARELARRGLRVASLTAGGRRGVWDGVDYASAYEVPGVDTRALVVQRASGLPRRGLCERLYVALHDAEARGFLDPLVETALDAGHAMALCVGDWQRSRLPSTWRARTVGVVRPELPPPCPKVPGRWVFPAAYVARGLPETLGFWRRLRPPGAELVVMIPPYGGAVPADLPPGVRLGDHADLLAELAAAEGVFYVNTAPECLPNLHIAEALGCRIHVLGLHPLGLCGIRDAVQSALPTTDPIKFVRDFTYLAGRMLGNGQPRYDTTPEAAGNRWIAAFKEPVPC